MHSVHLGYFAAVIGERRGIHDPVAQQSQPIETLAYYQAIEFEVLHYHRRRLERIDAMRDDKPQEPDPDD